MVFSPSLFFQYTTCPHWIWHDRFGDPTHKGELPELAQKLLEQGVLHEEEFIKDLPISHVKGHFSEAALEQTQRYMKAGVPYIYQGALEYTVNSITYRGRPDILEKRTGKSNLGDYYYTPIDIKNSKDLKKDHWLQLTLYALILEYIQDTLPQEVGIINAQGKKISFTIETLHLAKTQQRIQEIIYIMKGNKPALKLISKCKNSPWFNECIREAEAAEDIALIYKLDARVNSALRIHHIDTLKQFAKTNLTKLPTIPYVSSLNLERAQLQAKALIEDKIYWLKDPSIPEAPIKIYFDIEGDPLLHIEYLFGFWIVGDTHKTLAQYGKIKDYPADNKYYLYFLATDPTQEADMWNNFIQWVTLLKNQDYLIYHFADYERTRTKLLAKKYRTEADLESFSTHLVDLSKVVQQSVILPLYFYSIKDIAKSRFLDYKWRHPKAGGAQSIFWYEKWLETRDPKVLEDIINYNEDDVVATEYLHLWLQQEKN